MNLIVLHRWLGFVLGVWVRVDDLILGLDDGYVVGKRLLWPNLAIWIPRQHNLDLDSQNSLTQKDVTGGCVNVVVARISGVNHESIDELHGLCTLTAQFSGNDDLATLGTGLHDETENSIASATDGQTSDQLITERFSLGDSAETTSGNFLGVKLNSAWGKVESRKEEFISL